MQQKSDDGQVQVPNSGTSRTFGEALRRAREQAGLSQRALAARLAEVTGLKLDHTALTRIETDQREPKVIEARALAAALGVQLDDLVPPVVPPLRKLWLDLDDAGFGLLDAVYEYGVRRRALSQALEDASVQADGDGETDPFIRKILGMDELEQVRNMANRRAIRDWQAIRADHGARSNHNPPRDESVFDAEA
ncbi:helix-turn-helix domain-containing protein [Mycolicibacterium sp. PAM1]|uniref:Transcriptional regulator, Fis family n=1 Tax=Mycolicibacterium gilvum (strain PYR-GCK) TaxID=350054 RepID=A4TBL0_MYCGI|nr:helix-turn-helix transcriptional regulator [Mycolicibacterium sp. PAM1]ABP45403.1 transcriptional regulator, Fis family [Mycolicibacterium gilvum PYR-GCK]MBV5244330.1 helix-turn-helix domain-containing protein [Mycolicibacterium sp. PAM1]